MEVVEVWEEDLMGVKREAKGVPWKDDLWSKKDGLGVEDSEVRAVAMAAIECGKSVFGVRLCGKRRLYGNEYQLGVLFKHVCRGGES